MPTRDWRLRIEDILESITIINSYVEGADFQSFATDTRTIDAVVRRFGIIGEAANNVPATITAAHPLVPWKKMREMRNVIVHVYFGVNAKIVWQTIKEDLPPLVPLLEQVLKETP